MVWGSGYNMVQCSVHSATVASVVLLSAIHETYRKASTCLKASQQMPENLPLAEPSRSARRTGQAKWNPQRFRAYGLGFRVMV